MKPLKQFIQFVREAYSELRKVGWLGRKELIASTIVIIIFIVLAAIFIGSVDFVLARILGIFLRRGG